MKFQSICGRPVWLAIIAAILAGCSGGNEGSGEKPSAVQSGPEDRSTGATDSESSSTDATATASTEIGASDTAQPSNEPPVYKPVKLGGGRTAEAASGSADGKASPSTAPPKFEDVVKALKPLQIVLGNWTGILKNGSTNEAHEWAWDLKTDPVFPALVAKAPTGSFFTTLRLTYDPRTEHFVMTTTGKDGVERKYEGAYKEPPQDVPSEDGKKVERTFKLELTQTTEAEDKLRYQFVINQQHNNRYLMEVHRARGTAPLRLFDVIGTQRDGVSFAKADDDYGEQTCVISGGLGTMSVSYKGKSYPVCCTGCKAAFEEDPERWLARFNEQKMKPVE